MVTGAVPAACRVCPAFSPIGSRIPDGARILIIDCITLGYITRTSSRGVPIARWLCSRLYLIIHYPLHLYALLFIFPQPPPL